MAIPDMQQAKKLNEMRQEGQNLSNLVNVKNDQLPMDPNLTPFYLRESSRFNAVPQVPENILGQEMEEERENSNNGEGDD